MSREIKFRGWDGENMYTPSDSHKYANAIFWSFYEIAKTPKEKECIFLMQYTGLKDKNGKEIYEGDIVNCWDDAATESAFTLGKIHTGCIEFNCPAFELKTKNKLIYDGGAVKRWECGIWIPEWYNAENIEVIGNIYSNPELLTTK